MTEENKLKDIVYILRDLLKVIKVVSMYPENNPLPTSLRRSFSEKLESVIDEYGELSFDIDSDLLTFDDEVVYQSKSKEENLAGIFYDAGVTEISFLPGLDVIEIYAFLDAVKQYINSNDKSLDLVTMLWEASVTHIKFKTLQDIALTDYDDKFDLKEFISADKYSDYYKKSSIGMDEEVQYQQIFKNGDREIEVSELDESEPSTEGDGQTAQQQGQQGYFSGLRHSTSSTVLADTEEEAVMFKASEAASAMGFETAEPNGSTIPDTALILNKEFQFSKLDEEKVSELLEDDASFDPYQSTVGLLKEMLHQESEMSGFYETVQLCEKIISEFIALSRIAEAGHILKFLKVLEERIRPEKALWAERLKDACITAGSRDRMKLLGKALNENQEISTVELNSYLSNFTWETLINITDLIGLVENQLHKDCIVDYLTKHGRNYVDVVGKGIFDKRADVVCNAISILVQIGDKKSINYLNKVVDHREDVVRLRLVAALKDSPSDEILSILQKAVFDKNPQVRREAVDSIVKRKGKPAFELITEILNEDDFILQDNEDQAALLKAYSKLGGDHAVEYLVRLTKTTNLFGDSKLSFLRSAAFEALSINKSDKCELELLKLSRAFRPDLKRKAQEALKNRRDYIYGDVD